MDYFNLIVHFDNNNNSLYLNYLDLYNITLYIIFPHSIICIIITNIF